MTKEEQEIDNSESGTNTDNDYKDQELSSMSLHVRELESGKVVSRNMSKNVSNRNTSPNKTLEISGNLHDKILE